MHLELIGLIAEIRDNILLSTQKCSYPSSYFQFPSADLIKSNPIKGKCKGICVTGREGP
jgi:hypothetical protein